MSSGVRPACLIAAAPASMARLAVVSPSPATRRSRMPVRSTIHSSLVSTRCSRSALVSRCSGTAVPQPGDAPAAHRSGARAEPGDRLALADPLARGGRACPMRLPRNGLRTGVEVPGPSTHADGLARRRRGRRRRRRRRRAGGTRRPAGATITRSGTSEPLAVDRSAASMAGDLQESWGCRRGWRRRGSTGRRRGRARLASAGEHRAVADLEERGRRRAPTRVSIDARQRTGTRDVVGRAARASRRRRRRRRRRRWTRPARAGRANATSASVGGERRRRRRA